MKDGDKIPAIIGWEYHGQPVADVPGLVVVAEGTLSEPSRMLHAAVVYPCSKGNWVFNAGTCWWSRRVVTAQDIYLLVIPGWRSHHTFIPGIHIAGRRQLVIILQEEHLV